MSIIRLSITVQISGENSSWTHNKILIHNRWVQSIAYGITTELGRGLAISSGHQFKPLPQRITQCHRQWCNVANDHVERKRKTLHVVTQLHHLSLASTSTHCKLLQTQNCHPAMQSMVIKRDNLRKNNQNTHTHIRLTALCPGLPGSAGTRKVKQIWILLKQETVSGSGISWAAWAKCKSALRSRQRTRQHPSLSFYRPDAQPTASKHWRQK